MLSIYVVYLPDTKSISSTNVPDWYSSGPAWLVADQYLPDTATCLLGTMVDQYLLGIVTCMLGRMTQQYLLSTAKCLPPPHSNMHIGSTVPA